MFFFSVDHPLFALQIIINPEVLKDQGDDFANKLNSPAGV